MWTFFIAERVEYIRDNLPYLKSFFSAKIILNNIFCPFIPFNTWIMEGEGICKELFSIVSEKSSRKDYSAVANDLAFLLYNI